MFRRAVGAGSGKCLLQLVESIGPLQFPAEIAVGLYKSRPQPHRLRVFTHRLAVIASRHQRIAQVKVRIGDSGPEPEGTTVAGDGIIQLPEAGANGAPDIQQQRVPVAGQQSPGIRERLLQTPAGIQGKDALDIVTGQSVGGLVS